MTTTLRDVARHAGVSVKTVSNVVNDHPHVSDEMRRRVREALGALGYRPNLAARTLRTGRTGLLALVVPDVEAPGLHGLVREVVRAATSQGFRVVVEHLGAGTGRPAPSRSGAPPGVDAVLLGADPVPPGLVDAHLRTGTPLVLLGESGDPRCDQVCVDGTRAAADAVEHLVRTGRRRIAAIGARPGLASAPAQPRILGYRRALRRAGLDPPTGYVRPIAEDRHEDGYRAARWLFAREDRPDGVVCHSDRLAVGALRAAADAGLRVPGDVAVIGFGDSAEGGYSRPTLTSVSADPALLAREAVTLVTARLDRPDAPPTRITAPHAILPRESTRPAG
ncbi:LacI family DNA-binding transcriptional regulator [Micromonospora chaiyaphumensis]|uniref:Transcriptional regulator, LacI family n=1 Tax=Micromonospora chaiyaphumensis TaxID=307119 RepID=A0A1C4UMS1_9ACTN|nr:LacI family DNA-binding transcriptional regulator [Micromonospora chaiyaphumensis]SCE72954.1 transcriptional regulator, LacI family [Micromonospora chaiyaphumensis]